MSTRTQSDSQGILVAIVPEVERSTRRSGPAKPGRNLRIAERARMAGVLLSVCLLPGVGQAAELSVGAYRKVYLAAQKDRSIKSVSARRLRGGALALHIARQTHKGTKSKTELYLDNEGQLDHAIHIVRRQTPGKVNRVNISILGHTGLNKNYIGVGLPKHIQPNKAAAKIERSFRGMGKALSQLIPRSGQQVKITTDADSGAKHMSVIEATVDATVHLPRRPRAQHVVAIPQQVLARRIITRQAPAPHAPPP